MTKTISLKAWQELEQPQCSISVNEDTAEAEVENTEEVANTEVENTEEVENLEVMGDTTEKEDVEPTFEKEDTNQNKDLSAAPMTDLQSAHLVCNGNCNCTLLLYHIKASEVLH